MTELSRARRLGVLAICCMSLLIVGLDNTIVNVGLPAIRHELHASVAGLQWIIDAYTLVLASLLMLSGSTADRIGRKRVFAVGLVLFTAGSLLCSVAPGLGWLVAFRAVQAIGGSMLNPVAMSIITNTFLDARERAQAIGVWGGVIGLSMALGPVVGGALVDTVGWRSIFWINVPVGVLACLLTLRYVPESRAPRARRLDPVGQVLALVGLTALTFGIIEGPGRGWTSSTIVGCFVLAALAFGVLPSYERRRAEPLLDPRFFRSVPFSGAVVIAIAAFAALAGFLFVNTLYLQTVRGLSPLHAGLATLPMAGLVAVCAPLSGRAVAHFGARPSLLLAGVTIPIGVLLLVGVDATTSWPRLIAGYVLFGTGFGAVNAPITNTAVAGMPRAQAGVAAAIASTSRQVGASLGVAVVGAAVASEGGVGGVTHPWEILVACGVLVLFFAWLTTTARALRTAERTATALQVDVDLPRAVA